jgi:hypothetical protein
MTKTEQFNAVEYLRIEPFRTNKLIEGGSMTFEEWFLSKQGEAYDSMYVFAKDAWNAAISVKQEAEPVAKVTYGNPNNIGWNPSIDVLALPNGMDLFASPPTPSAAVAAFKKKTMEVMADALSGGNMFEDKYGTGSTIKAIQAIPADETALMELMMKAVRDTAAYAFGKHDTLSGSELQAIIDRVLSQ